MCRLAKAQKKVRRKFSASDHRLPFQYYTFMAKSPVPPRKKVKEETRLVLEAFLQRALSTEDKEPPGHVGRGYHDPQSFMHSTSEEHAPQCPGWTHVHEEINHVEEKKHGFRSSVKRLLERRPSPRRSPDKQLSSKDSLKRTKAEGEVGEKARPKRSFSFKNFLRKKGAPSFEGPCPNGPPQRPDSLPVVTCYCRRKPAEQQELRTNENGAEGTEIYTLAAEKLEHLVKKQQLISPSVAKNRPSPIEQLSTIPSIPVNSGELPTELDETQKEEILQKLIALLEEQAEDINKEIEANPLLRNTLNRLSYRSFSRLAEAFTSQSPTDVPSPQLAKLALTMELTRKVAGINSHTVHTLMGYSLQYMDMFIPWLQQQGGWENIVTQDEIFDLQLD